MLASYIDHMGNDLTVVNSARVSFNKESSWEYDEPGKGVTPIMRDDDKKLIKYLATHNHWTPFSHPQITIREKVPIFVARQRFKHMVGFTYNEVSRRYVDDTPEFYYPGAFEWRSRPEKSIKQGSGDGHDMSPACDRAHINLCKQAKMLYEQMIADGIAPEQARMVLPQSMYTEYYVTGSLAAWARAYKQRIDAHAQAEIQDLAEQWGEIIQPLFPVSWEMLTKGTC